MSPYARGMKAFRRGELANPYNEGTQRYRDWARGFDQAYFRNLERQVKYEETRNTGTGGGNIRQDS